MLRQSLVGQCRFKFFSSRARAELALPVCHGCGGLQSVCRPARLHPDSSSSKRGFSFTGIYSLRRGDCGAAGCSGSDGGSNRWPAAADGAMEGYPSRLYRSRGAVRDELCKECQMLRARVRIGRPIVEVATCRPSRMGPHRQFLGDGPHLIFSPKSTLLKTCTTTIIMPSIAGLS